MLTHSDMLQSTFDAVDELFGSWDEMRRTGLGISDGRMDAFRSAVLTKKFSVRVVKNAPDSTMSVPKIAHSVIVSSRNTTPRKTATIGIRYVTIDVLTAPTRPLSSAASANAIPGTSSSKCDAGNHGTPHRIRYLLFLLPRKVLREPQRRAGHFGQLE